MLNHNLGENCPVCGHDCTDNIARMRDTSASNRQAIRSYRKMKARSNKRRDNRLWRAELAADNV